MAKWRKHCNCHACLAQNVFPQGHGTGNPVEDLLQLMKALDKRGKKEEDKKKSEKKEDKKTFFGHHVTWRDATIILFFTAPFVGQMWIFAFKRLLGI